MSIYRRIKKTGIVEPINGIGLENRKICRNALERKYSEKERSKQIRKIKSVKRKKSPKIMKRKKIPQMAKKE